MKNTIIFFLQIFMISLPLWAQFTSPKDKAGNCNDNRRIYKVCSDQREEFEKKLDQAKKENKFVLIKFGADWCPWCVSLHKIFTSPDFKESLDKHFVLSEIGVFMYDSTDKVISGTDILSELLKQNNLDKTYVQGTPFLVVLNPTNNKGIFINTADLEKNTDTTQGHDQEKLLKVLEKAHTDLSK